MSGDSKQSHFGTVLVWVQQVQSRFKPVFKLKKKRERKGGKLTIMRKSLLISIALFVFTLVAATAAAQTSPEKPIGVVNINSATAAEIAFLPGIGEKTAAAVVAHREQNGPFKKTTDLMQVKGIGDRTFERLQPYLTIEGKTTLVVEVKMPRKPSTKARD
jgi:comEA protein